MLAGGVFCVSCLYVCALCFMSINLRTAILEHDHLRFWAILAQLAKIKNDIHVVDNTTLYRHGMQN